MEKFPLMNKTLSALLNEGETLQHPIYAILERGGKRCTSYFGFTDGFFLIALTHENNETWSERIPLEIKSLKVEEFKLLNQKEYEINIAFENNSPVKIIAGEKTFSYGNQKEQITAFLNHLYALAPKKTCPSLREIKGARLRRQYFSAFLYFLSPVPLFGVLAIIITTLKHDEFVFLKCLFECLYGVWISLLILSPLILLTILNRFFFGKIVCVMNRDGMYLKNDFIPWGKIVKITYIPEFVYRYHADIRYRYTRLLITVCNSLGKEHDIEVKNFPFYGLFKLKRLCPDKKIKFIAKEVSFVIWIWSAVLALLLIAAFM